MREDRNANAPVAGGEAAEISNGAGCAVQVDSTTTVQAHASAYRGPAVWRNADHDEPVTVTGCAGTRNGELYFAVSESAAALPECELIIPGIPTLARLTDLVTLPQWVVWRLEPRPGEPKPAKVPYNPRTGRRAKASDPATWGTFAEAVTAYRRRPGQYAGIGFELAEGGNLTGVDFDGCVDPDTGAVSEWAAGWVRRLATYTEVSQSGRGLHCIGRGTLPPGGRKTDRLEVYDSGRFFALTGDAVPGAPLEVADCSQSIAELHAEVWPPTETPVHRGNGASPVRVEDSDLLEKARQAANGARFDALWNGDTSAYGGDDSAADLALCDLLAFWTGGDAERIDRLFRQSGLYRPKWERLDYRERTIGKALEEPREYYAWPDGAHRLTGENRGNATVTRSEAPDTPDATVPNDALPVHLTDLGNARRMARHYGGHLRFCHPWGRWLVWDGQRWALDDTARVERAAKATVGSIYAEAAACQEDSHRKELAKHALRSEAATKLRAMMDLTRSEPGIPVLPDALDADPWLLTVANGTLDLRTGELRPHSPGDLITKLAPVPYDAAATCPRWLAFLAETFEGNGPLMAYVQKMAGYALTGDTSEQSLFVLWGTGQNGKSTMLSTLGAMQGDYWKQTPTETLLARSGNVIPNDVAALKGARLVTAIEADEGRRLAESLVKQMTGGDPLAARFMRAEWFNFLPTFKLFLATNHKPEIRGTDLAIWRRIRLIPFRVTVPASKQDKHLGDKLKAELPGILAWAVRGCLAWQREGMAPPAEVVAATTQYREEMDPLADFLAELCIDLPGIATEAGALFKAYSEWCERGGEKPLNQTQFGRRLAERGYQKSRNDTTRRYQYHGIALRSASNE